MLRAGLIFTVAVLFVMGISAQDEGLPDAKDCPIAWQAVLGAGSYQILLQDHRGVKLLETKTKVPQYTFHLIPGSYQFQITTFNRFQRPESSTAWFPFRVNAVKPPEFLALDQTILSYNGKENLNLTGEHLARDLKVTFVSPLGQDVEIPSVRKADGSYDLRLPSLKEAGSWGLKLLNNPNLETQVKDILRMRSPAPIVATFTPEQVENDTFAELTFQGDRFTPTVSVYVQVEKKLIQARVLERTETSLTVDFPLTLPPGKYNLVASNDMGLTTSKAGTLLITLPKDTVKPPVYIPPPLFIPRPVILNLGWSYDIVTKNWKSIYKNTPLVGTLDMQWYWTKHVHPEKTVAADFGVDFKFMGDYFNNPGSTEYVKSHMVNYSGLLGPNILLSCPWIHLRMTYLQGYAYSTTIAASSDGESTTTTSSLDTIVGGSVGLEYVFVDNFRLELSGSFFHFVLPTDPLEIYNLGLSFNYAF